MLTSNQFPSAAGGSSAARVRRTRRKSPAKRQREAEKARYRETEAKIKDLMIVHQQLIDDWKTRQSLTTHDGRMHGKNINKGYLMDATEMEFLISAARTGCPTAKEKLAKTMMADPELWRKFGDLYGAASTPLMIGLAGGDIVALTSLELDIRLRSQEMRIRERDQPSPPSPATAAGTETAPAPATETADSSSPLYTSPVLKLSADQVLLTWLDVHYCRAVIAGNIPGKCHADYVDKRLARAERRHAQALLDFAELEAIVWKA